MPNITKSLLIAASVASVMTASAPAFACGFIACALRDVGVINEDQRRALDQKHEEMGRPLDHAANQAAGAAANAVVPGSGVYVTQGLELRDQYNRSR